MPLLRESVLLSRSQSKMGHFKTAETVLFEHAEKANRSLATFDIFISHSTDDARIIVGLIDLLEKRGLSVYVDWYIDPHLDRSSVTAKTAELIRMRMRQSKALMYAFSENSSLSKWMQWECGFFDGYSGKVCVCPITTNVTQSFHGQEFLGLYPYIDVNDEASRMWVNRSGGGYKEIFEWIQVGGV